jgi:GT2 family glycosyltransferase
MKPVLTAVIPTYGRVDSLGRLLRLLEKQTIAEQLEIVVVDQNEKELLEKELALSALPRVLHVWQERPNASLARNEGAMRARADRILFLDDDLLPGPTFCEDGLAILRERPFVRWLAPWVRDQGRDSVPMIDVRGKLRARLDDDLYEITDTMSAALFVSRDAFIESGGFDELLFEFARTAEDEELFLRLKYKGMKLYYAPRIKVVHDESQQGGCELRTSDYWATREKCIKSWVYRHKIHAGGDLHIGLSNIAALSRSVFLNRAGLAAGLPAMWRQVRLLKKALLEADSYLAAYKEKYRNPALIDHLITPKRS